MQGRTQKEIENIIDPEGDNGATLATAYNLAIKDIIVALESGEVITVKILKEQLIPVK